MQRLFHRKRRVAQGPQTGLLSCAYQGLPSHYQTVHFVQQGEAQNLSGEHGKADEVITELLLRA